MGTSCSSNRHESLEPPERADYSAEARLWADSVAASLNDTALVGQMIMPALYAHCDLESMAQLRYYTDTLQLGGIILLKGNAEGAAALADSLACMSHLPTLVAIDAEWGIGMRISDAPQYPVNGKIRADVTEQTMYEYGAEVGRQAQLLGINVIFGPVLDVLGTIPSAISKRSFGRNPKRVATLGVAYARGLEDAGVISVAKHFPGIGATPIDTHRARPIIRAKRAYLDTVDLLPFREYIKHGLSAVMVGHTMTVALDSVERSAVVSPMVIDGLLRSEYGFDGLVFTDALNMGGLGNVSMPVLRAILAGANIVVAPADTHAAVVELLMALHDGRLPRQIALERCSRILAYKYKLWMGNDGIPLRWHRQHTKLPDVLYSPATTRLLRLLTSS